MAIARAMRSTVEMVAGRAAFGLKGRLTLHDRRSEEAEAPTMPMVTIEGNRAGCEFLRPFPGASMNDRPLP